MHILEADSCFHWSIIRMLYSSTHYLLPDKHRWKHYSSTIQALTFSAQQEVICIWEYVHTRCLNLRRNSSKFTRHNTSFSSTAAVVFASIWRAASFLCSSTSVSLLRLDIIDGLIWLFFVVCYLILHRFARLKFLCIHNSIWRSQD